MKEPKWGKPAWWEAQKIAKLLGMMEEAMACEKCAICGVEGTPWASMPRTDKHVCRDCFDHPCFRELDQAVTDLINIKVQLKLMARAVIAMDIDHDHCPGSSLVCYYCEAMRILKEAGEVIIIE